MAKLPETVSAARVVGGRLLQASRKPDPEGRMPLMEHIRELRNRILKAALGVGLGMILGFVFFDQIWNFVKHPFCSATIRGLTGCNRPGDQLIVNGVLDPFMLHVKIAFFAGLIVSSPIWLYQIWAFIAPGLYRREKRWSYAFVGAAVPLFAAGAVLAYEVMSRGLHYLLGLTPPGVLNLPSIDTYLGYFQAMILGFGLAFELPLVLVMLNLAHVLTHARFKKWRRLMIFLAFVFAGIANPSPDPVSMLLLAFPIVILTEVAEVIIWANDRRRAAIPDPYAGLADDEASPMDMGEAEPGPRDTSTLN